MKKYTVYEIEKLTNGRITKYKLNQAIEKGELKAELVSSPKKGRGMPKYFVYDGDLQKFLQKFSEEKNRKIILPEEESEPIEVNSKIKRAVHEILNQNENTPWAKEEEIGDLRKRLSMLETKLKEKSDEIGPFIEREEIRKRIDDSRATERRELIVQLASVSVFSVKKRREILQQLNKLS